MFFCFTEHRVEILFSPPSPQSSDFCLLPSYIHLRFSLAYCLLGSLSGTQSTHSTIFLYSHTLLGISLVCFWICTSTIFTQFYTDSRVSPQRLSSALNHQHLFHSTTFFCTCFSSSLFSWRQQWAFKRTNWKKIVIIPNLYLWCLFFGENHLSQICFLPLQAAGPEVDSHHFGRTHQSLPSAGRSHWLPQCVFQFYSLFLKWNLTQQWHL